MALRVYLSGGMEYAADEGRGWRTTMAEFLRERLGAEVFNPNEESERFLARIEAGAGFRSLKQTDPVRFQSLVAQLVDIDCREIAERSDLVVCYWDDSAARGAGTKGELTMARFFRKPVYMVTAVPPAEIPGWVLGCTTRIFPTFAELQSHLLDTSV